MFVTVPLFGVCGFASCGASGCGNLTSAIGVLWVVHMVGASGKLVCIASFSGALVRVIATSDNSAAAEKAPSFIWLPPVAPLGAKASIDCAAARRGVLNGQQSLPFAIGGNAQSVVKCFS